MNVTLVFMLWALVAVLAFARLPPHRAVLLVFLGGWLVLPVGQYPVGASDTVFSYWIIGLALPSDMLLTKAWVAPLCALLGVVLFDRQRLLRFRPTVWDIPMLLWCVWPVLQGQIKSAVQPQALVASAYLAASWGLPWMLGRMYFGRVQAQGQLLAGLAWAGLACLPIALLEGAFGPFLYGWLYEVHPFTHDGDQRYVGWRPLGFFENGNQYGLWVSACALACLWVWRARAQSQSKNAWKWGAWVVGLMAVASQSVGAVLLLMGGVAALQLLKYVRLQWLLACTLGLVVLLGSVYVSGKVPLTHWAKETALGQTVVGAIKSTGRGSFTWRISQDQKAIALVKRTLVVGHGQWDWWQSLGTRPWGLALLMVGQYGLVGLALAFGVLGAPAVWCLARRPCGSPWNAEGAPAVLAVVVLIALADAGLNSFFFFPALLAAAALVPGVTDVHRLATRSAIPIGTHERGH